MELEKDTIITLENQDRYIISNITFYGGVKYALAQKENSSDEKIILEELFENGELFVQTITDNELSNILFKILDI